MEDIFYLDSAMVVDITTMALAQEERVLPWFVTTGSLKVLSTARRGLRSGTITTRTSFKKLPR